VEDKESIKPRIPSNLSLLPLVGIAILTSIYANPFEYFWGAGSASYYQARIAFQRGSLSDKAAIARAGADGKITLREYSSVVFPAYLRVAHDGEVLFPENEQQKGIALLKSDLLNVLAK
jgi:hypothetical protein